MYMLKITIPEFVPAHAQLVLTQLLLILSVYFIISTVNKMEGGIIELDVLVHY